MTGLSSAAILDSTLGNDEEGTGTLPPWEALAVDAVGNTMDFWHFKRNHGRIWALLYLRETALTASELQAVLGLSKGAVSMLTRELETWGVLRRVRAPHEENWRFGAEIDFRKMIGRVIEEREASFVRRVRSDLDEAERLAKAAGVPKAVLVRMARLRLLAQLVDKALRAFVQTARLDAIAIMSIFRSIR